MVNDLLLVGFHLCPGVLVTLKRGLDLGCGASQVLCVACRPQSAPEGSVYPAGTGRPAPFRVWGPGLCSPPCSPRGCPPTGRLCSLQLCPQLCPPPWK